MRRATLPTSFVKLLLHPSLLRSFFLHGEAAERLEIPLSISKEAK